MNISLTNKHYDLLVARYTMLSQKKDCIKQVTSGVNGAIKGESIKSIDTSVLKEIPNIENTVKSINQKLSDISNIRNEKLLLAKDDSEKKMEVLRLQKLSKNFMVVIIAIIAIAIVYLINK